MILISSLLFALALEKVKFGKDDFIMLSFLIANVSSGVAYFITFLKPFCRELDLLN